MTKPIVSKRNHFTPASELVENALIYLPNEFKHPDFGKWLLRYTESVIKNVASHFGLAAHRGIEQAANLLCDPDFYETNRRQRSEYRKKMAEDRARQDWERIERQNCPTAEQIAESIKYSEEQLIYHQQSYVKHERRLAELKEMRPKNIRLMAPTKTQ